jgi:hypothetical protein
MRKLCSFLVLMILIAAGPGGFAADDTKPVATADHPKKVVLEVMSVRRTNDGFFEVTWRYRNPTDADIKVFEPIGKDSTMLAMRKINFTYADGNKIYEAKMSPFAKEGMMYSSHKKGVTAPAKDVSESLWIKMAPPQKGNVKKITLNLPDVKGIDLTIPDK